jgi:hypothetical protein
MNYFSFEDTQASASIVQKVKSLSPADFPMSLGQLMASQSLSQVKAITLLLQKDIELDKLVDIKTQQIKMRDIARRYLDAFIPKILSLFTDVSGFYNSFASYYLDIHELLNLLTEAGDESEKIGSLADIAEAIQDLIQLIREKQNKANGLIVDMQNYQAEQQKLDDSLKNTQKIAEQLYIGEQTEIKALQTKLHEHSKEINDNNAQIASGALHRVKNILKISTALITEYTPDKKSATQATQSDPSKSEIKKKEIIKEVKVEPIPVITSNLQVFVDNKPVPSLYQEKLQTTLILYRECIEKLKKYSIEASIYTALIQEWISFAKNICLVEASIKYLAIAWQGLSENFDALKQKLLSATALDSHEIEYIQQQWSLTRDELAALYKTALYFQTSSYLEVISTVEAYDRNQLGIPKVKNARFMQKIIAKNSKEKSVDK